MTEEKLKKGYGIRERIESLKDNLERISSDNCKLKFCRCEHPGHWTPFDFWRYELDLDTKFPEVRETIKAELEKEMREKIKSPHLIAWGCEYIDNNDKAQKLIIDMQCVEPCKRIVGSLK